MKALFNILTDSEKRALNVGIMPRSLTALQSFTEEQIRELMDLAKGESNDTNTK